jgi:hypothetical protein
MLRPCDVCGQADEEPRHISAVLNDSGPDTIRHFACCAAAGCPDGSCDKIMAEATGGSA